MTSVIATNNQIKTLPIRLASFACQYSTGWGAMISSMGRLIWVMETYHVRYSHIYDFDMLEINYTSYTPYEMDFAAVTGNRGDLGVNGRILKKYVYFKATFLIFVIFEWIVAKNASSRYNQVLQLDCTKELLSANSRRSWGINENR
ncbi:hypothetical protein [Niallia circulans]|uniref:hypothetical protein n=1 Tax=Niallia circulans TaxID=1397 RepID=UPI00155F98B5|nr:hypothetical protein [Niallia circulans]NRG31612.1 hypothetical protein [Niallia circulans]